jgi:hypothetical protein
VGGLWLGGISFWAACLFDQIKTDIYQARHHYRLDKSTVLAGIEIAKASWISIDEEGMLYGIETAREAVVSIDGALWRGDIRLIPFCPAERLRIAGAGTTGPDAPHAVW